MLVEKLKIDFKTLMNELKEEPLNKMKGTVAIHSVDLIDNGEYIEFELKTFGIDEEIKDEYREITLMTLLCRHKEFILNAIAVKLLKLKYDLNKKLKEIEKNEN